MLYCNIIICIPAIKVNMLTEEVVGVLIIVGFVHQMVEPRVYTFYTLLIVGNQYMISNRFHFSFTVANL